MAETALPLGDVMKRVVCNVSGLRPKSEVQEIELACLR